jgi:uncharacterized protein (TIGR04141 family)
MPRGPSADARTTVYRLVGLAALTDGVRTKYLDSDDFSAESMELEGREALLVTGSISTDEPSWVGRVVELTGSVVEVRNVTSAGALLVRDGQEAVWALTYGMGFQLLDQAYVDPGFGQRIALRTVDPDALRSLTRTTLDQRSRTDRSSIPSGDDLRSFGVGDFGEIVSRVVAPAAIAGLKHASAPVTIRGADALSVPIARKVTDLLADLDVLRDLLSADVLPELESLEQLKSVRQPDLVATLDGHLRASLEGTEAGRLAMSWPHERVDENGTPTSFRVLGAGRGNTGPFDDVPSLAILLEALRSHASGDVLEAAVALRVQLFRDADGDDAISGAIPVRTWLAFEVDLDGRRYCLHDGRWYLMDQDYAARLQRQVQAIFDRPSEIVLPPWTSDLAEEQHYNKHAALAIGATMLDRDLIRTDLHRRGIEACDLVTPRGLLIHVKNLDSSAAASHLVAQALVSTEALLFDEDARTKLRAKIAAAGGDPGWLAERPTAVALGLARATAVTAADLFTFTQVTLARLDAVLSARGVTVAVIPIVRE